MTLAPRPLPAHDGLPPRPRPAIGREGELRSIAELLALPFSRLLTIVGSGGVGKTRLALEVAATARGFDEVRFTDLSRIRDVKDVIPAIAASFEVSATWDRSLGECLRDRIGEAAVLLVLDNFEHLVVAAPLIADLLAASPNLRVLATSREPLRLTWEQLVPLRGLPVGGEDAGRERQLASPAVALFIERAKAARPDLRPDDRDVATIAAICARVDGLPLAIELAAARLRTLSPAAVLERVGSGIDVLADQLQDVPVRHHSLRATLHWSYDLLDGHDRALFRALSVFAGGFTPDAAAAVAAAVPAVPAVPSVPSVPSVALDESALAACIALARRSLLVAETEQAEPRFRMLETVRSFAAEELRTRGELDDVQRRHAEFYLRLCESGAAELGSGAAQVAWLDRCELELDNIREALRWSLEHDEHELGLRLASAVQRFWFVRGRWSEGETWLRTLLERADRTTAASHARGLHAAALLLYARDAYPESAARLEQAVVRHREASDERGAALCLNLLGMIARRRGRPARAVRLHSQALEMLSRIGDHANVARSLENLAGAEMDRGAYAVAERHARESVAGFESLGYPGGRAYALGVLAGVLVRQGNLTGGAEIAARARREADAMAYPAAEELALLALGRVAERQGNTDEAARLLAAALERSRMGGSRWSAAAILDALAAVHAAGEPERAAALVGAVDRIRRSIGAPLAAADRPARRRLVEHLRRRLGDQALGRAQRRGAELDDRELIAVATSPSPRESGRRGPITRLSRRERQIAGLVADGLTNREIAGELGIREATAESHVQHILNKLGARRRSQIAAWASTNADDGSLPRG